MGIRLTPEVLDKIGISLPGSENPVADKGQRSVKPPEELTGLVDGHIRLCERLASQGRVPPLDPSNSLTRIGANTNQRLSAQTAAMAAVTKGMRMQLVLASDDLCEESVARRAAAYVAVLQ